MKKNHLIRNLSCGVMAAMLLLTMSLTAFALNPSIQLEQKQEEEQDEFIQGYTAVDGNGEAIGCIIMDTPPLGDVHSLEDALNTPHIDTIEDCYIKVTPMQQAQDANATANLLDLTEEELKALATASGIGYETNQALIELALKLTEIRDNGGDLESFIAQTGENAMDALQAFLNEHMTEENAKNANNFDVAAIFDITANKCAYEHHEDGAVVDVMIKVDGVKAGQSVFLEHICEDGSVEYIEAVCESDGIVSFQYVLGNDGPYILYALSV